MILRFSRFRFKEGNEAEGEDILQSHATSMRASAGCVSVWVGQGKHPSTEFVVVAFFDSDASLRGFEGELRGNPSLGGDFFSLLRLTSVPPEVTEYEVRASP